MAYDDALAKRVRACFASRGDITEKKMFGGLAFMIGGHMCAGVLRDSLVARVGPDAYNEAMGSLYTSPFDFTGKPLTGFVYVAPEGIATETTLRHWLNLCESYVFSLPPK